MIEQRTIVDQIEIRPNGVVQVRIGLQIVQDGKVIANEWHRTALPPGHDPDAQFAVVNTNLVKMGKVPVRASEIDRVKAHADTAWTPEVIAAYQAAQEKPDEI